MTDREVSIEGHTILSRLGRGGMAEVLLAREESLGRLVAIKVIGERFDGDPHFRKRFEREARSAAALAHPNIVQVHRYGYTTDGRPYLSMAYLKGGSLRQRLEAHGPLPLPDALRVTREIASALLAAHEKGIVHRDLKPDNVMFQGETAVLTDFGIARVLDASTDLTNPESSPGTVLYFSPEQAHGSPVQPQSDIYTLGVVLYEMLTGSLPIVGDTVPSLMMRIAYEVPRPLPPAYGVLQAFLDVLLAKSIDDRFASCREVVDVVSAMERNWLRHGAVDRVTEDVSFVPAGVSGRSRASEKDTLLFDADEGATPPPSASGATSRSVATQPPEDVTPGRARTPKSVELMDPASLARPEPAPLARPEPAPLARPEPAPARTSAGRARLLAWLLVPALFGAAWVTSPNEQTPAFEAPMALGTIQDRLASGGVGPQMVVVAPGTFVMGSLDAGAQTVEQPVHEVKIARAFAIARTETTFEEYDRFAAATGRELPSASGWGRALRPVINVDWEDAVAYAEWLSGESGHVYRLPSEAEWEYVARSGTVPVRAWDMLVGQRAANCSYGVLLTSMPDATLPVASLSGNPLGVHDTYGNVSEWMQDCWVDNYEGVPADGSARRGAQCAERSLRGGSWGSDPNHCLRPTARSGLPIEYADNSTGFRVLRELRSGDIGFGHGGT